MKIFPWPFQRYLMIFLKFVQAVIPTIEYDYTRHFTMWSCCCKPKRILAIPSEKNYTQIQMIMHTWTQGNKAFFKRRKSNNTCNSCIFKLLSCYDIVHLRQKFTDLSFKCVLDCPNLMFICHLDSIPFLLDLERIWVFDVGQWNVSGWVL